MKFSRLPLVACLVLLGFAPALGQDGGQMSPNTYNENRMSALEDQMRALNGRLEQVEFSLRRLDQTLQRMQSDNDARLTRLENAQAAMPAPQPTVSQPAPPPAPVQQPIPLSQQQNGGGASQQAEAAPIQAPNGTLGALKLQDGRVTGAVNNPQAPPLPTAPPDYGLTPQEQYDRAFDLLRQANYGEAEAAFKTFIDKNPKDKLIDNAKYWYGETLYVRARFDDAAVAFADAYQQNPQGNKAPDSLLKLAMSLGALNKTPDACTTLLELKSKYPNAAVTIKSRAADERARLKCPAH